MKMMKMTSSFANSLNQDKDKAIEEMRLIQPYMCNTSSRYLLTNQ